MEIQREELLIPNESSPKGQVAKGSVKTTEISLGEVKVRVRTDATPHVLKQVKDLVELNYNQVPDNLAGGLSPHQRNVLVAYNLAEELLEERARYRALKKEMVEKSEALLERVESFRKQSNTR